MSKKLIIAFSALALAILAGAVAVVGVFAAQQQKVANTFAITYTANNVSAWVSANYTQKGGNFTSFTGGGAFTASQAETTKTLSATDIELTATSNYVVLIFSIQNENSAGGKAINVTVTDTSVYENVDIYYQLVLMSDEHSDGSYDQIKQYGTTTVPTEAMVVPAQGDPNAANWGCLYMVIEIDDNTLPASYVSTAEKGINITLTAAE